MDKGKKEKKQNNTRKILKGIRALLGQQVRPFLAYTLIFVLTGSMLLSAAEKSGAMEVYFEDIYSDDGHYSQDLSELSGDELINEVLERYAYGEIDAKEARRLLASEGVSLGNSPIFFDDEEDISAREREELDSEAELALSAKLLKQTEDSFVIVELPDEIDKRIASDSEIRIATESELPSPRGFRSSEAASPSDIELLSPELLSGEEDYEQDEDTESTEAAHDISDEDPLSEGSWGFFRSFRSSGAGIGDMLGTMLFAKTEEETEPEELKNYISEGNIRLEKRSAGDPVWRPVTKDNPINDWDEVSVTMDWSLPSDKLENGGRFIYRLPAALTIEKDITGEILKNGEQGQKIGEYTISQDGTIILDYSDGDFSHEQGLINSRFWVKARAELRKAGDNGDIVFDTRNGSVTIATIVTHKDLSVHKRAQNAGDRLNYVISIGSQYGTEESKPIELVDRIAIEPEGIANFDAAGIGDFSLKKINRDGGETLLPIDPSALQINSDGSFRLTGLEPLKAGERYELWYSHKTPDGIKKYENQQNIYAVNKASAKWEGGNERNSEVRLELSRKSEKGRKRGDVDKEKGVIHWKVTINPEGKQNVSGWSIHDGPDILYYKGEKYNLIVEDTVRLYGNNSNEWWKDSGSEKNLRDGTYAYSYDRNSNKLSFKFPNGSGSYSYLLEYDTTIPELELGESKELSNSVSIDGKDYSSTVTVHEDRGRWGVEKKGEGYAERGDGDKYIFPKWTAAITEIPKTPIKELVFEDYIKGAYSEGKGTLDEAHFGNAAIIYSELKKGLKLTLRDDNKTEIRLLDDGDALSREYKLDIKFFDKDLNEITDIYNSDPESGERVKSYKISISRKDGEAIKALRLDIGEYSTVQDISKAVTGQTWDVTNEIKAGDAFRQATNQYFVNDGGMLKGVKSRKENKFSSNPASYSYGDLGDDKLLDYRLSLSTLDSDNGKDLVLRDVLPAGMELLKDSISVQFKSTENGKYNRYLALSHVSEGLLISGPHTLPDGRKEFTITIRDYKRDKEYSIIDIDYSVEIKSGWTELVTEKSFVNELHWKSRSNMKPVKQETTVKRSYDKLKKEGVQLRKIVNGKEAYAAQLDYKLYINTMGEMLGEMDTLSLVDELTAERWGASSMSRLNPQLIDESIRIYRYDETREGNIGEEIKDSRFAYTYYENSDDKRRIEFKLPNGIPLVLVYSYSVSNDLTNEDVIKNKASLTGGYESKSDVSLKEVSSGASSSRGVIRLQKVDSKNHRVKLDGAVFRLRSYDPESGSFVDADIEDAEKFTVNGEKLWDLSLERSLKREVLYQLEELTPPLGYSIGDKYHYFIVKKDNQEDDLAWLAAVGDGSTEELDKIRGILSYLKGGAVYKVENKAMLMVEKQWLDINGTTLYNTPDSITVSLRRRKTPKVHTVFFKSTGTKSSGNGNYEIKESFAPIVVSHGSSISFSAGVNWRDTSYEVDIGNGENAEVYLNDEKRNRIKLTYASDNSDSFKVNISNISSDVHVTVRHLGKGEPAEGSWNAAELWDFETEEKPGADSSEIIGNYTIYKNPERNNTKKPWSMYFSELEPSDMEGNDYFYSIEELNVPEGFKVSYSEAAVQSGLLLITNQATTEHPFILPETGGIGTSGLYKAGISMLMLAILALCDKRKRERFFNNRKDKSMKKLRKIISVILTLAMLLSISVVALADTAVTEFTIKKRDGDSHSYAIYQIFTGAYSSSGTEGESGKLSDIRYGKNAASGTTGEAVPEDVLNSLTALDGKTDREKLEGILPLVKLDGEAFATLGSDVNETKLAPGYYLISDTTELNQQDDAKNLYVVAVSENIEIKRKTDIPTVDKEIYDNADGDAEAGWGETADHNINESFQFRLTAKVPADAKISSYKGAYELIFHDTMSRGISFESIASVTVNDKDVESDNYTKTEPVAAGDGTQSWSLTIADAKPYAGAEDKELTVVVTYNAHLNEEAVIGNHDNNKNTVSLEFSNNPNGEGKGRTKEDTVWAFTYELKNKKVKNSEDGEALAGAGFRLYKGYNADAQGDGQFSDEIKLKKQSDNSYMPVSSGGDGEEIFSGESGSFDIRGLDAGTYYLRETTTPVGYNSLTAPVKIVIKATHNEDSETSASAAITITRDDSETTVSDIIIVNKQGITLPSTGGTGTTVLYAAGALLVLIAGAAVVIKRRREA